MFQPAEMALFGSQRLTRHARFWKMSLLIAILVMAGSVASSVGSWRQAAQRGTAMRLRGTDPVAAPHPLPAPSAVESVRKYALQLIAIRAIDGSNSAGTPGQGAAGSQLLRKVPATYPGNGSGSEIIQPPERANARTISNRLVAQGATDLPNRRNLTNFIWAWGQFIDHDLSLTGAKHSNGSLDVSIGDPNDVLGPNAMPVERSDMIAGTGVPGIPREHPNTLTAFIDASMVYGSTDGRAQALRSFEKGKLKTSEGDLLPFNLDGIDNGGGTAPNLFIAGDVRTNENVMLCAMHTLFMREHNRLAELLAILDPSADDERLYQLTRKIVAAEIQKITFDEFLPALMGGYAPFPAELRFNPLVNPGVATEFSTALFRVGHTLLSSNLPLAEDGVVTGGIPLQAAFFNATFIANDGANVDRLLEGFAREVAQEIDPKIIEDVRSFLFGPPGAGGLDLAVLNFQRGRDHGVADYNTVRQAYGLKRISSFSEITQNADVQSGLEEMYGSVDNIDLWIGALAEDHLPGSSIGPLLTAGIRDQFIRSAAGDRFFASRDVDVAQPAVAAVIDLSTLTFSDIIRANTTVAHLPDDAFRKMLPIKSDIQATFSATNNRLYLTGNREPNRVLLLPLPAGTLLVGFSGSLVNGRALTWMPSKPGCHLTVDLNDGDDSVFILGGKVGDALVRMGQGENSFRTFLTTFDLLNQN